MATIPLVKYLVPKGSINLSPGAGCKWWVIDRYRTVHSDYGVPVELTEEDILKVAALNGLGRSIDIEGVGSTGANSQMESFFLRGTD